MVFDEIGKFVDTVGNQINLTFKAIDDFIDTIITFFVGMGFWMSVLTFAILFILIISAPLILFKYWENVREKYDSLTKKMISSITNK